MIVGSEYIFIYTKIPKEYIKDLKEITDYQIFLNNRHMKKPLLFLTRKYYIRKLCNGCEWGGYTKPTLPYIITNYINCVFI